MLIGQGFLYCQAAECREHETHVKEIWHGLMSGFVEGRGKLLVMLNLGANLAVVEVDNAICCLSESQAIYSTQAGIHCVNTMHQSNYG